MPSPSVLRAVFNGRMLLCILTGFSSGLPLYVVTGMLPAWLRTEGVSLKEIGLFSLTGMPYVWKFAWAPLVDRYLPPFPRKAARLAALLIVAPM